MDLYVGGLYLVNKSANDNEIVMADENMGIRIVIVSGLVTRDRFIEDNKRGFKKIMSSRNLDNDVEDEVVDKLVNTVDKAIVLNYHKSDAVYLYKNGKERGSFRGLEFKQALFGIWLGGNPADDDLKEGMLGL